MIARFALLFVPAALATQAAFEAAVIKPADPSANGFVTRLSRTQVELRNCSLLQCIETAWALPEYAVSAPSWLDSVHFDVVAKLPEGASLRDFPPMLQTLLADRFALKTHTVTRAVPGYALTIAKGGPKMPGAPPDSPPSSSDGPALVRCRACTMQAFIAQLTRSLGRPIADQTSLAGTYNFDLHWTIDMPPSPSGDASTPGPSIFAAAEEQLGLKLQGGRIPTMILVVDGANRTPSGN